MNMALFILLTNILFGQEHLNFIKVPELKHTEIMHLPSNFKFYKGELLWMDTTIYLGYKKTVDNFKKNGVSGFRIQIYGKTGKVAYQEALKEKSSFLQLYPDVPVYTIFNPPDFKVQVGNFLYRLDAYLFLEKIKYSFPYSIIVPANVLNE